VQVFLKFAVVDDTIDIRGKFDASSAMRSRDNSSQTWHRGICHEKRPEKLSPKNFKHPSMFYFFTKLPKFHLNGRGRQWLPRANFDP